MRFNTKDDKSKFELMIKLEEFQENVKAPKKDMNNPFTKSKYATLQSVTETVKEAMKPLKLAFFQDFNEDTEAKTISVQTIVLSELGTVEFNPIVLPIEKMTAQGVGSAITYARRYALTTNLGVVADEDDDGNYASGRNHSSYSQQPQRQQSYNRKPQPKPQSKPQPKLQPTEQQKRFKQAIATYEQVTGSSDWKMMVTAKTEKMGLKSNVSQLSESELRTLNDNIINELNVLKAQIKGDD
jgi:hypothetical protein